jgi:hypothetical protein
MQASTQQLMCRADSRSVSACSLLTLSTGHRVDRATGNLFFLDRLHARHHLSNTIFRLPHFVLNHLQSIIVAIDTNVSAICRVSNLPTARDASILLSAGNSSNELNFNDERKTAQLSFWRLQRRSAHFPRFLLLYCFLSWKHKHWFLY